MAATGSGVCRRLVTFPVFLVLALGLFGYVVFELSTPGEFSNWSQWTSCSSSCGEGQRVRSRKCDNPPPGIIGQDCEGNSVEKAKCMLLACPIDGGYSQWSKFGNCDKTCGGGTKTRTRTCTNPVPQHGGKVCVGVSEEKLACNINPCPVNGGYSAWGGYSGCEVDEGKACGKGKKTRTRMCNNPVPQHGGKNCESLGPDKETTVCEVPCPTTKSTTTVNTTITMTTTTTQPK